MLSEANTPKVANRFVLRSRGTISNDQDRSPVEKLIHSTSAARCRRRSDEVAELPTTNESASGEATRMDANVDLKGKNPLIIVNNVLSVAESPRRRLAGHSIN